jgi:L-aminopeptidase/D-esterase-like protein
VDVVVADGGPGSAHRRRARGGQQGGVIAVVLVVGVVQSLESQDHRRVSGRSAL